MPIGFTTGSLYKTEISFEERVRLYYSAGADAIELSFSTPDKLFDYDLSEESEENIRKFSSISIHAPWKEVRYKNDDNTIRIIEKLRTLCDKFPVTGLVLHPDTIDDFDILEQSGLPFLIENMDRRKTYGTHPDQFRELKKKYSFGFVLDVEHAYEHYSSMQLAKEFIEVMGDRLKHMHISGCSETEIHVPVCCADNREAITEILKIGVNVPKILEGVLSGDIDGLIKRELDYVGNFSKEGDLV